MMHKDIIITILDEVYVRITGLKKEHLEHLYDKYGIFVAGYFFMPEYKLGRWDGKIRFFDKTGKVHLYLIEEILPILVKWGYKITLFDKRTVAPVYPELIDNQLFAEYLHVDTNQPTILRDHQVNAVNSLIEHGNGIVVVATAGGKTIISAAICSVYGNLGLKTLTIVPNQDLIKQTKADYITYGLNPGEYSGKHKDYDNNHIVSTWQALNRNRVYVQQFDVILVDECHQTKSKVLTQMITENAARVPYRFGVTGTMPKDVADSLSVKVALGPVRFSVNAADLIDTGVLSNLKINILQLTEDLSEKYQEYLKENADKNLVTYAVFKQEYFPDYFAEKNFLQKKQSRINWISDLIQCKADEKKGNTLVLVDSIQFGRRLKKIIPNAHFVNGQDMKDTTKRNNVYKLFAENDNLIVIATTHIAGTGISINRIFNLVLVDSGKSWIKIIQSIGRGLRKSSDKTFVNIIDICSDLKYAKKHLSQRVQYYDEVKYPFVKNKIMYETTT